MIFLGFDGKQKAIEEITRIIKQNKIQAILIALFGNLGTGKTTFAQMLIKIVTLTNENILSPTFSIVQHYTSHNPEINLDVWHYDLYRIKENEIWNIGLDESITHGISIVEWPENLPEMSEIERFTKKKLYVIEGKFFINENNDYVLEMS